MANPIILGLLWLSLALVLTGAYDPDLLQDFCVADDTSAGKSIYNFFIFSLSAVLLTVSFFRTIYINNGSVIDITDSVKVNGFPCKDPKMVKASDFLFQGLRNQGCTNNMFGSLVTVANVQNLQG
jgi:hypothetical protein